MEENGLPVERRASRISMQDEKDEHELAEVGYKQELKRDWGLMHNFGISFSIIVCFNSLSPLGMTVNGLTLRSQLLPVSRRSSNMG